MEPTIIKLREKSDKRRKLNKKKYDELIKFSSENSNLISLNSDYVLQPSNDVVRARLLDEGAVVDGGNDDGIRFVIKKGTIKKFYDNLSSDYVGYIKEGHKGFGSDPVMIGQWTKKDLSIVEIDEQGRYGLDVDIKLNDDLYRVKDLKALNYDLGISVEMEGHNSDEYEGPGGEPVIDNIFIHGFAVVGTYGNVNSGGINFSTKGDENKKMKFGKNIAEMITKLTSGDDKSAEETLQYLESIKDEILEEGEHEHHEEDVKDTEDVEETEETVETEDEDDKVSESLEKLTEQVENLTRINAEKQDTIDDLTKKLAAKESAKQELDSKIKSTLTDLEGIVKNSIKENKKEVLLQKTSIFGNENEINKLLKK